MRVSFLIKIILTFTLFLLSLLGFGQSNNDIVKEVQELLEKNYIFLDKAKETNAHLDALIKKGTFNGKSPEDFAKMFTEELQKITKDKHLRFSSPRGQKTKNDTKIELTQNLSRYRAPMLRGFRLMESNIGYIDLAFFGGSKEHQSKIDMAMKVMEVADAIIVDMRRNTGGSPFTVNYLSSYFFSEKLLLNTIYERANDHSEEMWVTDVEGIKRPKVPVYILTSKATFSGAEDFSYTMQSRGRATVIGEVTGGGAHPTRFHQLKKGFGIGIPFARTINTITKTNWEGVGVIPDIKSSADAALEKATELAKVKVEEYKKTLFGPLENTLNVLGSKEASKEDENTVFKHLDHLVKSRILNEGEINNLGYTYLQSAKGNIALPIFKANVQLFPDSANVYDSYAEALAGSGQKELALLNYEKAVKTATAQKDAQLEAFQNNLRTFKEGN